MRHKITGTNRYKNSEAETSISNFQREVLLPFWVREDTIRTPVNTARLFSYQHKIASKYNPISLLFKYTNYIAWTSLWNTAYYKNSEVMTSKTIKHEECHLLQISREGRIKFTYNYLMETYRQGYWNNKW